MTLAEIRSAVDTWLANRWNAIQNAQANYVAAHGRYFQGLFTHSVRPTDGAETAPDRLADKPTDQAHRWADFINLPATMPTRIRIDVYSGPIGAGYVATVDIRVNGTNWRRSAQVGPETWRTRAWHQVTEAVQ